MPLDVSTAYFNPALDFNQVGRLLDKDEILIIKNHQVVIKTGNCNIQYNKRVICGDNEEIMRLLVLADVLITDFSSVYFDALMLDKPVLFYAEDVDEYLKTNELYDDYENFCPGELLTEPDAGLFVKAIRNSKEYVHTPKYQSIKRKFVGNCDGQSGKRLAVFLKDILESK